MKRELAVLIAALTVGGLVRATRSGQRRPTTSAPPASAATDGDRQRSCAAAAAPAASRAPKSRPPGGVGLAARGALAAVDDHFARWWPAPGEARLVARLFTGAVALAFAGILAATMTAVSGRGAPLVPLAGQVLEAAGPEAVAAAAGVTATPAGAGDQGPPTASPGPPPPGPPTLKGALPVGKGMWLYIPEQVEGGNAEAIAARATAVGLTHLYVRTGSSVKGFYAQRFLDELLPVAHAHNLRVYGWDFPYFFSWSDDVFRALEAIHYTTPDGHRIDGFSADIETRAEGTRITAHHATEYGNALRSLVGPNYPLIATIPRPSKTLINGGYPFAEIVSQFDAVAPMVYWQNREPGADVAGAMDYLSAFGKPVIPIGQAYDGGPEGGPPGVPPRGEIIRFMQVAEQHGATAVSFWSWQHANQEAWDAIADAAEFRLHAGGPSDLTPGMVRAYQNLLTSLGFPTAVTGQWDAATAAAVASYQQASQIPVTATVDERTRKALLTPFSVPVQPQR